MAYPCDWVRARDASITINGHVMKAMTCSYSASAGRVDRSYVGNAYFLGTTDIITADVDMTIGVLATEGVPAIMIGGCYDATYTTTGGLTHTGKLVVESMNETGGARGGYDVSIRGFYNGTITNS